MGTGDVQASERRRDAFGFDASDRRSPSPGSRPLRLVDQHHRNAVAHLVHPLQPGIVQERRDPRSSTAGPCPRDRRAARAAPVRAPWRPSLPGPASSVDASLTLSTAGTPVEGANAAGGGQLAGDERQQLGDPGVALVARLGLEVEAQQRLGVRRAQVEPPRRELDGEPVEAILPRRSTGAALTRSVTACHVVDVGVDLAALRSSARTAPAPSTARRRVRVSSDRICTVAIRPESAPKLRAK